MTDAFLSPAEAARRLGVSAKALRLYEQRGLVTPVRAANGYRAYGPEQIARLHQILALRHLGLPLAKIGQLLSGRLAALDALLALQEETLSGEAQRVSHALMLVRAARKRLGSGEALSIDDLTTLTTETTMTNKLTNEERAAMFAPLIAKHYEPGDLEKLKAKPFDPAEINRQWEGLFAEARALMAKGDPTSPAAIDLARRWSALVNQFTGGDPALGERAARVWKDAMADPGNAGKLPVDPAMWDFIGKAMAAAKAQST